MEEILASIRRIIADDDAPPGLRREDRRRGRVEIGAALARSAYSAPVLERRKDEPPLSRAEPDETEDFREVRLLYGADSTELETQDEAQAPEASEIEGVAERDVQYLDIDDASPGEEPPPASESQVQAMLGDSAFSDMLDLHAQEALRPMVRQWLDENLSSVVKRLVRAEIERITAAGGDPSASAQKSPQP
ncbi:MAG: DUF2497 domain-containing protein [Methylocystis sp.]|uniref:DUF2497 domain-containing protein n=1 Tax=Methylocystis sp. TaxID=1911079 RepID=UPI003D0A9B4D